jgi:IS30 family transposase
MCEVLLLASRVVFKDRENLFWNRARVGMSAAAACNSLGMNRRQGYRWIQAAGGQTPVPAVASSGRSPSTICRELRRNSHPTMRSSRPYAGQKRCVIRAGRPKPSNIDDRLPAAAVEERLKKKLESAADQ